MLQWIPEHCDIFRNKGVDEAEKKVAHIDPVKLPQCSLKICMRAAAQAVKDEWTGCWRLGDTDCQLF